MACTIEMPRAPNYFEVRLKFWKYWRPRFYGWNWKGDCGRTCGCHLAGLFMQLTINYDTTGAMD